MFNNSKPQFILSLLFVFMLSFCSHAFLKSRATQGWWNGNVEMVDDIIRADVYPFFIDVEEEVILTAEGETPDEDELEYLEIYGTFTLPSQAVITGVLIWDGDRILKGKLKPDEDARLQYEDVVDRDVSDPPAPQDPVIIEYISTKDSVDTYEIAVFPVIWGESRRIRIRYLLPQIFKNQQLTIPIPTIFGDNVSVKPDRYELQLNKGGSLKNITLEKDGSFLQRTLPVTMFGYYEGGCYTIMRNRDPMLYAQTSFPNEPWQGNYLLFWGQVPDSLLQKAGLSMEVVFLWRWNNWNSFIRWSGSNKYVSNYGKKAISQSDKIKSATKDIVTGTGKVGMVLDRGDSAYNRTFPVGGRGSPELDSLNKFLTSINDNYFLSTIPGNRIKGEDELSAAQREAIFQKGANDFKISVENAYNLYSPVENVIKHMVIVTVGPRIIDENSYNYFEYPDYLNGITVTGYGTDVDYPTGYWAGVPMDNFINEHRLFVEGYTTYGFTIPPFKEANFTVELSNENKSFMFDIFGRSFEGKLFVDDFYFAGHALTEWDTSVVWKAYSNSGDLLAKYKYAPDYYKENKDTAVAKIWAGLEGNYSETYRDEGLGVIYGYVDNSYSLVALPEDTMSEELAQEYEYEGVPYLKDSEIFQPVSTDMAQLDHPIGKTEITRISYNAGRGITEIFFNLGDTKDDYVKLKIFDSKGRVVAVWNIEKNKQVFSVVWDGKTLSGDTACRGVYLCVLESSDKKIVKTFVRV